MMLVQVCLTEGEKFIMHIFSALVASNMQFYCLEVRSAVFWAYVLDTKSTVCPPYLFLPLLCPLSAVLCNTLLHLLAPYLHFVQMLFYQLLQLTIIYVSLLPLLHQVIIELGIHGRYILKL